MKLSVNDTKKIAAIANLTLDADELQRYTNDLQHIFAYANEIKEVDTSGVITTPQPSNLKNVYREDIIKPSLPLEEVLASAAKTYQEYFEVEALF